MKPDELIRDPVFQLNLLLWMAKEQPVDNWRVRPLFWELGFAILYVEQPFRFPVETTQAVQTSGLAVSDAPEPELILARGENGKALYFEAKANSFGPTSSNCHQARGHLLAVGPAFAETYKPLTSCLLCYVLPSGRRSNMASCLGQLAGELKEAKLSPGAHSVHGLSAKKIGLVYSWDKAFKSHTGAEGAETTVIKELADDTDPTPLLLVYTDEDSPNPQMQGFYRRAMLDHVRARLLCDLHAQDVGNPYTITVDDLLKRTTEGIFEYLARKRQGSIRRLVRTNFLGPICDKWKDNQPGCVSLVDDTLTVQWSASDEKETFMDWLEDRATRFPEDRLPKEGPTLFDTNAGPPDDRPTPKEP